MNDSYSFNLGKFKCSIVNDGTFEYPIRALFSSPPQDLLEQVLKECGMAMDTYVSPYPSLLVDTGSERVLVDTGAGALAPTTGRLMANLEVVGVKPEDIDTVILTHGHADHIGSNIDAEGEPAFPKARYVMWQKEWEFWQAPDLSVLQIDEHIKGALRAFAHNNLPPIKRQLELIDGDREIVPGIQAIAAPGHTPGHMALRISSEGESLLHLVDAVAHPVLMEHPDWFTVFDYDREQSADTRRRLLDLAAEEGMLVFGFHFPFPGLGHVQKRGDGWQWQALEPAAAQSSHGDGEVAAGQL